MDECLEDELYEQVPPELKRECIQCGRPFIPDEVEQHLCGEDCARDYFNQEDIDE